MLSKPKQIALFSVGLLGLSQQASYDISLERINHEEPLLNNMDHESNFTYNYNPSYISLYDDEGNVNGDALLVRS